MGTRETYNSRKRLTSPTTGCQGATVGVIKRMESKCDSHLFRRANGPSDGDNNS